MQWEIVFLQTLNVQSTANLICAPNNRIKKFLFLLFFLKKKLWISATFLLIVIVTYNGQKHAAKYPSNQQIPIMVLLGARNNGRNTQWAHKVKIFIFIHNTSSFKLLRNVSATKNSQAFSIQTCLSHKRLCLKKKPFFSLFTCAYFMYMHVQCMGLYMSFYNSIDDATCMCVSKHIFR